MNKSGTACLCSTRYFPEARKESIYFCTMHAYADDMLELIRFTLARCVENGFQNGDIALRAKELLFQIDPHFPVNGIEGA